MIILTIRIFGFIVAFLLLFTSWHFFSPTLDPTFGKEIESSDYNLIIYPLTLMAITLLIPIKAVKNKLKFERILILSYVASIAWVLGTSLLKLHGHMELPWWMLTIVILNMLCVIYQYKFKVENGP